MCVYAVLTGKRLDERGIEREGLGRGKLCARQGTFPEPLQSLVKFIYFTLLSFWKSKELDQL